MLFFTISREEQYGISKLDFTKIRIHETTGTAVLPLAYRLKWPSDGWRDSVAAAITDYGLEGDARATRF